jgi:hypothetical protein
MFLSSVLSFKSTMKRFLIFSTPTLSLTNPKRVQVQLINKD